MIVIGLTGGIGAGKSAVAKLFAEMGAVVVDADDLARQVVAPGGEVYDAIVERFGSTVVDVGGHLDRSALGAIVFDDNDALADLNAIVHPAVDEAMARRLGDEEASGRVVVAVVPLLVEVDWQGADAVVVVDSPEDLAVDRVVRGRGMTEGQVRRRIAAQARRADRLARADRVIVNDGSWDHLRAQVDATWQWIQTLRPRSGPGRVVGGQGRPDPDQTGGGPGGLS